MTFALRRPLAASLILGLTIAAPLSSGAAMASKTSLRVCADANYMPFSNRAGAGFENAIARKVGALLNMPVTFTFDDERGPGGFVQFLDRTLRANKCDLVVDVPYASDGLSVSEPYYISSYVFVFPKGKHYNITSMDSPVLQKLRIGFEEDTPAENGLKLRALSVHARAFDIGDDSGSSPADMLHAIDTGKINVAVTWEPAVGYFLQRRPNLSVVSVPNSRTMGSPEQYAFPMAMATRTGDTQLTAKINRVIAQHKNELTAVLGKYGVKLYVPGSDVGVR